MRPNEFPPQTIRATLWRIVDMGRLQSEPRGWSSEVTAFLTKDQLRHVFVADRLVDDWVAFRMHSGRNYRNMDDVRQTLKRIFEHGKLPGVEVDHAEEADGPVTKIVVVQVYITAEEIQQLVMAGRIVDEKIIIMEGEEIVSRQKALAREAKAKADKADKAKKS